MFDPSCGVVAVIETLALAVCRLEPARHAGERRGILDDLKFEPQRLEIRTKQGLAEIADGIGRQHLAGVSAGRARQRV
jgi:hypothetical protein